MSAMNWFCQGAGRWLFGRGLLLVLVAAGCGAPIRVQRGDPDAIYRSLADSALTGSQLSNETRGVVWRHGIGDRWIEDPLAMLQTLHQKVAAEKNADPIALYALSELALYAAQRGEVDATTRRCLYLSAAVYG